ncbi:MAG: DegT/DnrJ/EryC1/StrS family aminotransferase, partial [Candidatus Methylomirabilis sp.]
MSPRAVVSSAFGARNDNKDLAELVRDRLGVWHIFYLSSGRAALTIVLRALQRLSDRREVIIPAYTCFSVPSAVVRGGLAIRLCDVDPKTLDLDRNALMRLDLNKALCIVPSGLYGMPSDLTALEEIARASGSFVIDDAAQCLGATLAGRACGTFGDAGFFSLGRGKNITAMGGGILSTRRSDIAQLIEAEVGQLPPASVRDVSFSLLGSLAYAGMLGPSCYWLLDRIPFLGLGVSRFDPDFAITQLSPYQGRLAAQVFSLVDSYNRIRRENAHQLQVGIEGIEGIEVPRPVAGADPVFLRFPILARDEVHRTQLVNRLRAAGIGASTSYPSAVSD